MKKFLFAFLLIVINLSATTLQPIGGYHTYDQAGNVIQDWIPAEQITLDVHKGDKLYISNYVNSWYSDPIDIGLDAYPNGYHMDAGKYGYIYALHTADGLTTDGIVHYGSGESESVEWTDGTRSVTTMAYLLDGFEKDGEIFLVMSPNGYDAEVNSHDPVNDPPAVVSALASRQAHITDLAGNVRVNFGTSDLVPHEFVIGRPESQSGQPIPGIMTALTLITVVGASVSHRKQSE